MARKVVADAAKAKAEKQKKMVIVLGVVLALAMAFAVHTMMSLNKTPSASSRPQAADPSATTVATTTVPTGTTPALPAAPTLSGAGAPTSTTSTSSTQLVAAVTPPADSGQLQSFSLFESKDPFHAKGPGSSSSTSSSPSSPKGSGGSSSGAPKTPPAPPTPPPTSAVISVNGAAESVTSGGNFPASEPLFQLLSLTAKTAKISVVGGSYASGAATLTLTVNKAVTLVNTADGTRYTIELMPQGTVPPAAAPSSDTTTTDTTTTTTTSSSGG